jgi:hypothetical protein
VRFVAGEAEHVGRWLQRVAKSFVFVLANQMNPL